MDQVTGAQDVVAAFSDDDDWIGGGERHVWRASDTRIDSGASDGQVAVSVTANGRSFDQMSFVLAAPVGRPLTTGVYAGAERPGFGRSDRPALEITSTGRGCNRIGGSFEIRDIARDAEGRLTRLWAIYEQLCDSGTAALWGEIRIGMPPTQDGTVVVPSIVRWPAADRGTVRADVPVTVLAGDAPLDVDRLAVTGDDPSDVRTVSDRCSGTLVRAGGRCEVWMTFDPARPGLRQARLDVLDAGGGRHGAQLQGWSFGGTTRMRLDGEPGEWLTQGGSTDVSPADLGFVVDGRADEALVARLVKTRRSRFLLLFVPPTGEELTVGTTYVGTQRGADGSGGPRMAVDVGSRVCSDQTGSFTIEHARRLPDGSPRSAAVRFEQRCDAGAPLARGTLQWRVGDNATPAPWMSASDAVTPVPAPASPYVDADPEPEPPVDPGPGPTAPAAPPADAGTGVLAPATLAPAPGGPTDAGTTPPVAPPGAPTAGATAASVGPATVRFLGVRSRGRTLRFVVRTRSAGRFRLAPTLVLRGPAGRARSVPLGARTVPTTAAGVRTIDVRLPAAVVRRLSRERRARLVVRGLWRPASGRVERTTARLIVRVR